MADDRVEPGAQRRRIDVAHQAADILHLPPLRFVAPDALRLEHGLAQRVVHWHLRDLRLGKFHQFRAERLQRGHQFRHIAADAGRW